MLVLNDGLQNFYCHRIEIANFFAMYSQSIYILVGGCECAIGIENLWSAWINNGEAVNNAKSAAIQYFACHKWNYSLPISFPLSCFSLFIRKLQRDHEYNNINVDPTLRKSFFFVVFPYYFMPIFTKNSWHHVLGKTNNINCDLIVKQTQ